MTEPRPLIHLREFATRYPGAFDLATDMRRRRGVDLPNWPDTIYLPVAGSYAIVSARFGGVVPRQAGADIGICAALVAWRATKGVYRFAPELLAELIETPLSGHLPDELLERLPEWCVYVDLNGALSLSGFYAHLERDANNGRRELRLVLDTEKELLPVPLHLTGGNLSESIESAWEEANRQGAGISDETMFAKPQELAKQLSPLISLLLYLCSERPEIDESGGANRRPQNLIAIKTKHGVKEFPASTPTTWNVGWRIGAALRAAQQTENQPGDGTHTSPRPHIRRAHWHTYLTGPGRTLRQLRWVSPILVGANTEELPAVIHQREK